MDGLFKGLFGLGGQSMYANPAEEARVRNQRAYPAGASGPTFDAADTRGFGQKMSDALMGLGSRQGWQDYAAASGGTKPQYSEEMVNQLLGTITPFGMVSPKAAASLLTKRTLPEGQLFKDAVSNTPNASISEEGLRMRVQRNQLPEQGLQDSVRGGVFYLPEGAAAAKHYSTGRNGYGGGEKITGETLINNPMFVKGATGGKAPELAYDTLVGKGAYQEMRRAALDVNWGRKTGGGTSVEDFIAKYAPELAGQGEYILANSKQGNQLAYALQEAAVASAARNAGHDAVLGYSVGRGANKGKPNISEVFDVREMNYPDKFGTPTNIWDVFKGK